MTTHLQPPEADSILPIEVDVRDDVLVLRLAGEMDLSTRGKVEAALGDAGSVSTAPLRVDLAGLDFCDASGVAELLAVRNAAARSNRSMATQSMRPQVLRLLHLTRAAGVLGAVLPG